MKRSELKRYAHDAAAMVLDNVTTGDLREFLRQALPDGDQLAEDELHTVALDIMRALDEATLSLEWDDDTCQRVCPGH
jgi:hypothetical protein